MIPHRVVHHWDFATHRVCRDARAFLDATRFLPVFDLPELSPSMFADHEVSRCCVTWIVGDPFLSLSQENITALDGEKAAPARPDCH